MQAYSEGIIDLFELGDVKVLRPSGTSVSFLYTSISDNRKFLNNSKRHTKSHTLCRRCGNRSFHKQHKSAFDYLT